MKAKKSRISVDEDRWVCMSGPKREGQVVVLGLVDEGERQDAHQQEGRPEEGEEEELDGRVGPPLVAPAGDDEVGRHERQLEHEEEHEQVERQEAAHHRGLQQEHPGEVDPAVLAVAPEDDGDGEEHRGHQDQEDRDAVDAEVPVHPERAAGVLVVRDQLEPAVVHLHGDEGRDGEAQRHERRDEGERVGELAVDPPVEAAVEAEETEHGGADGREQDEQGQEGNRVPHPHHVLESMNATMRAMPSAMPSA